MKNDINETPKPWENQPNKTCKQITEKKMNI